MRSKPIVLVAVVLAFAVAVPGASAAVSGTQTTADAAPSTLVGSIQEVDANADDNVTLSVSNLSAPANASQDEEITITATVTNTGNGSGEATVEYRFNGSVEESEDVELDAGNSTDVAFEFEPATVDPGTYTHGVYTDADNETAQIDIEEGEEDDEEPAPEPGPEPGPPSDDLAAFQNTSALDSNQTTPDSLAGKLRVEDSVLENTTVELAANTSTNYTLDITVTGNATNVTFFLQQQALESSQNVSDVVAYLDGEEMDFYVDESAGPGNSPWVLFEVDHFSTRTVSFTSEATADDNTTLSVSNLSAPANASQNGTVTVNATVTNTGNESGEGTVEYRFNGSVEESEDVELDAGNSTDVAFEFEPETVEVGTYTHGVFTDADNETAEIEIEEGEDDEEPGPKPGPEPGPPPQDLASFQETSPLTEQQTTPDNLSGKIRVEDDHHANTTVELAANTSTEYTLNITVTGNATNVTFFLQSQAIESSQNISEVVAYLDGEEMDFYVDESAGPGNSPWTLFRVDHFSTRTITFTSETGGVGPPAVVGDTQPRDLNDDGTYEDVDGDGDFDIFDIQVLFNNLQSDAVQNNPQAFNFNGDSDNVVNIFDVQALFTELLESNS